MKIQCSCGTKYQFEVTPEMAKSPVRFVCSVCGRDSSDYVARLVYDALGIAPPPAGAPAPVATVISATPAPVGAVTASTPATTTAAAPTPVAIAPAPRSAVPATPVPMARAAAPAAAAAPVAGGSSLVPVPPALGGGGLKIHRDAPAAPAAGTAMPAAPVKDDAARCARHPGQFVIEKCRVCGKPLCPQCMVLFGYVCSPLCRGKAEAQGIELPVYAGQKTAIEAKIWRKTVLTFSTVAGSLILICAVWAYYSWFLSRPKTSFSVRFPEKVYSGSSAFAGKDQIVFLRGGTLARYDMKTRKEIWSVYLIDKNQIAKEVDKEIKDTKKLIDKLNAEGVEDVPKMPNPEKLAKELERSHARELQLRVAGENIWVMKHWYPFDEDDSSVFDYAGKAKLTRYEWDTGKVAKEVEINSPFGDVLRRGDELLLVDDKRGRRTITHIDLNTTEMKTEVLSTNDMMVASATGGATASSRARFAGGRGQGGEGLPTTPGKDKGKPLDPAKVKEQVQHLPLPAKIALPATIANTRQQDAALREMSEADIEKRIEENEKKEHTELLPTQKGFVQVSVQMLEKKLTPRNAMKAASSKPALDGNVTAGRSMEVAQDMLNEMQRERGGGMVYEDESKFRVKVQHPETAEPWVAELIGRPEVFPLQTVTVVAPNKMIIVLDKANKKLWQATLTYDVAGRYREPDPDDTHYGQGPCVERDKTLYVFDEGMLTSFDLATGNVHWRVPSVGISGIFFDEAGNLYLNTSDASPDTIKYSRQIDLSSRISAVVMKVEAKTGKTLWTAHPGGDISYISGKYIYSLQEQDVMEEEDQSPYTPQTGFEPNAYMRIRRIDPKTGKVMWEHFEERCPLHVEFDKNVIQMVFKKEVKVMKYFSF